MENELIQEKISWAKFLMIMGLSYLGFRGLHNYRVFSKYRDMYSEINSSVKPSKAESVRIDSIRKAVIDNIRGSKLFSKFNKEYIIDSIKNINIRVVDAIMDRGVAAYYTQLPPVLQNASIGYDMSRKYRPNSDDFIIIARSTFNADDCDDVVSHELYHYFDRLIGGDLKKTYYSDSMSRFVDNKIYKDSNYAKNIFFGKEYNRLGELKSSKDSSRSLASDSEPESLIDDIYTSFISVDSAYITSNTELFARYKTLKHFLHRNGFIKNVNDELDKKSVCNIYSIMKKDNIKKHLSSVVDSISILLILDWDKLKELE